ncbi:hypothetical protein [Halosimplex pelagicum]|uniref:Uncharacterized protein n=1 Tax=Halosimplex pelagicum TaxID=869886 RepID=A0A7D5T5H0_9EURY|nr:hypothetical protein [Halosimplex pelagicum]QLH82368.1 hypothetical protein HZS54_12400 [Halosimplex pelagicum]
MNRRAFLSGTGIAVSAALAGCSSESTPDPTIENVSDEGTELAVTVADAEYADRVEFNVENEGTTKKPISGDSPTATYSLGDPETLGTKKQRLHHQSEIQIVLYKQDGSQTDLADWVFKPELELTDVIHSNEFNYDPENYAQKATPVFEISNTGNGPTRIGELVVLNIEKEVPLDDSNQTTGFARSLLAREPTNERLHPIDSHEEHDYYIPGGESAYFAAKGLLTHSGEEPKQVESVTQHFDVEIRWLFDDLRYTVATKLTGGITQSSGEGMYRFTDYELKNIDYASPLR